MAQNSRTVSPALAAIAGLVFPGAGYWLIGQKKRAALAGGGVLLLFVLGLLIAGVRVINVPGYGDDGRKIYADVSGGRLVMTRTPVVQVTPSGQDATGRTLYTITRLQADGTLKQDISTVEPGLSQWVLLQTPMSVLGDNISYLGQALNGSLCAATSFISIKAAQMGAPKSYSRAADVGGLYTAVAGMLNLMIAIDAAARAARAQRHAEEA